MAEPLDVLILEEASLEVLPKEIRSHSCARRVEERFDVPPEMQILDRNFHMPAMRDLKNLEKRGRPDVVHFALLDATSTPLFSRGKIQVAIHTIGGNVIVLKSGTRPPRTLQRFCGVAAKLLTGKIGEKEKKLFDVLGEKNFRELLSTLRIERTIALTSLGTLSPLNLAVRKHGSKRTGWIVGGFAQGHFRSEVTENSHETISISEDSLAAHVVTARLCYELEKLFEK